MAMDILENSYRRLGISEAVLDFGQKIEEELKTVKELGEVLA